jgi:type I restriction-modification system DNA methylase subunit
VRHRRLPADRSQFHRKHYELDRDQKKHLKLKALSGNELVDSVARLCVMNLYLHGIGGDDCPIQAGWTASCRSPRLPTT